MKLQYTFEDVKRAIPPVFFQRGIHYMREQRIHSVAFGDNGRIITAKVQGNSSSPYEVIAFNKGNAVWGNCSCPMRHNCKHVAAVLLHALVADQDSAQSVVEPVSSEISETTQRSRPNASETLFSQWLNSLQQVASPTVANLAASEAVERLLYIVKLSPQVATVAPRLEITTLVARLVKNGGYGKARTFNGDFRSSARWISTSDEAILRTLHVISRNTFHGQFTVQGAEGARLLQDIVATKRCHWLNKDSPALRLGETREAHFEWILSDDGSQHLQCLTAEGVHTVLPLAPLWYVDIAASECGPLHTGLPDALSLVLLHAPKLQPQEAPLALAMLQQQMGDAPMPLPIIFEQAERRVVEPIPCLRLSKEAVPISREFQWSLNSKELEVEVARLCFDYNGLRVGPNDHREVVTQLHDNRLLQFERDIKLEQHYVQRLQTLGLQRQNVSSIFQAPDDGSAWIANTEDANAMVEFSVNGVVVLRGEGWQVEFSDNYPYQPVDNLEGWYADLEENESSDDWFSLELGAMVDGNKINLLPLLLEALQHITPQQTELFYRAEASPPLMVRLESGRMLAVPGERVKNILGALIELYDTKLNSQGRLQLTHSNAAQLSELDSSDNAQWHWQGGDRLREFGRRLRDFTSIKTIEPPVALATTLRGYQQHGLSWLQFLREYELGGVLADDMGLGKTIQTLAHLLVEKESGRMDRPCLVIAPTSLMVNWRLEAERFAPSLRLLTLQGSSRRQSFDNMADYDVVLTTYPLLPRDSEVLLKQPYHLLILDEAQVIKNPKAKASQLVRQMKARHRLCLTGTPMENHLGELWSLFDFLMPGLLGNDRQFRHLFRTPIEKMSDPSRRDILRKRIAPFLLRRTKNEVAKELPEKTEILLTVELSGPQRDLYETIRLAMHEKVRREITSKGVARSQIVILDALLKLRQVCCDPRLVKLESAKKVRQSAKLELLMELLPEMLEEGRRVLLFSQFTSMLALIENELNELKLPYLKLTGDTKDRETPVRQFQAGEVPLFLISLKAGGTGLNLTAADTVIHYDPWWNPAVENQATDRAHRIGQDKAIFVYKFVTAGTVEEKILHMQTRKRALADSLFDEQSGDKVNLSPEDLDSLFEPLG